MSDSETRIESGDANPVETGALIGRLTNERAADIVEALNDERPEVGAAVLLGLPKESDWVLYAPYSDKSLMRDVLGYELSNQIGRYAARTRFVEVFLNDSRGKLTQRSYLGVYIFEEKIKRGKNRVAIEKLAPGDSTEPNISGGYIVKKDHSDQVDEGHTPGF